MHSGGPWPRSDSSEVPAVLVTNILRIKWNCEDYLEVSHILDTMS